MKRWKTYIYESPLMMCESCHLTKPKEEFQYMKLMPRNRNYNCMECEAKLIMATGISVSVAATNNKVPKHIMYQNPELVESRRLIKSILRTTNERKMEASNND